MIGAAPHEEDAERATDLIVLRMEPARVAIRLRCGEYASRYPGEFAIRASRPNGSKTELAKIIEGWGDYFFYGFAGSEPGMLDSYFLGDLRVFRLWFNRRLRANAGRTLGALKRNGDGSSVFLAFRLDELPPEFVIISGGQSAVGVNPLNN